MKKNKFYDENDSKIVRATFEKHAGVRKFKIITAKEYKALEDAGLDMSKYRTLGEIMQHTKKPVEIKTRIP